MTNLSYSNGTISDLEFERIEGKPVLGCNELRFFIRLKPKVHRGVIATATSIRAAVKLNDYNLGLAIPVGKDFLDFVHPDSKTPGAQTITFSLVLDRGVMEKVEEVRGGQDICFYLAVSAIASIYELDSDHPRASAYELDSDHPRASAIPGCPPPYAVKSLLYPPSSAGCEIRCHVPQSEWIRVLNEIGYARILLYEVPCPSVDNENIKDAVNAFGRAMDLFVKGDYEHAVGKCRECLEAAGTELGLEKDGKFWHKVRDQNTRNNMPLNERYTLMWESIRHITHLGHHETPNISRQEAHYVLGMTAIALSMAGRSPGLLKAKNT